jgi:Flp pilus assembly protein TadG
MRRLNQPRDERGSIAIEFLLTITMLIVVFMLMLQYAVKAHAQQIATAAAEEALAATSSYGATPADGKTAATNYLTHLGPGLGNSVVTITRTRTTATVTVSGDVDQLFPFLPVRISVHVQGPIERFIPTAQAAP